MKPQRPDSMDTARRPYRLGWGLLMATTMLWLLWMTSRPGGAASGLNLIPLAESGRAVACLVNDPCPYQRRAFWLLLINVAGNVLVFVPLGLGLAGWRHRTHSRQTLQVVALGGFLVSLAIELMQLAILSRATDVDDLIFNTLGALLGGLL
ncbi:MAG: VanZ family protein, partial [Chloroflexota bacterium]